MSENHSRLNLVRGTRSLRFHSKTTAQTNATPKLSIDFFTHTKDTYGNFRRPQRRSLPYTWGMNENAGMNSVELDKYFIN